MVEWHQMEEAKRCVRQAKEVAQATRVRKHKGVADRQRRQ